MEAQAYFVRSSEVSSVEATSTSRNDEPATVDVLLNGEVVAIPEELVVNSDLTGEVLNLKAFNSLPRLSRDRLLAMLPENDRQLDDLFNPQHPFRFGLHPLKQFCEQLAAGRYSATLPTHRTAVNKEHSQCERLQYQLQLLRQLLVHRRHLLTAAERLGPSCANLRGTGPSILPCQPIITKSNERMSRVRRRARKRAKLMTMECRRAVREQGYSSDDASADETDEPLSDREFSVAAQPTRSFSVESTLRQTKLRDADLYEPCGDAVTLDAMLGHYQDILRSDPEHPTLDTSDITLAEIIERAGLGDLAQKCASARLPRGGTESHPTSKADKSLTQS